jgi:hypothetical protein
LTPNIPDFVVTEDKSFIRDTKNRALLQTDRAALERHRLARATKLTEQSRINTLEREVAELKALVKKLLCL